MDKIAVIEFVEKIVTQVISKMYIVLVWLFLFIRSFEVYAISEN